MSAHAWLATEDFGGLHRVTVAVENTTEVADGLDRTTAMASSLLSTHVVVRCAAGGRFASPISPEEDVATAVMTCANVNIFPVLASPEDDAVLGAAIMLPDHPQLAPESRGSLFDSTEIEEALLLHVLALSDDERDQIAEADPAVRAMIERAVSATPEDIMALHGRVTVDRSGSPSPTPRSAASRRSRSTGGGSRAAATSSCGRSATATPRTTCSRDAARPSSASTSTTTTRSTCA